MVEINVKSSLEAYYTNGDGDQLFNLIDNYLKENKTVTVSFDGITGLNSSFVNSAFIKLLDSYSFEYIKSNLKFTKSTKQINSLIGNRFKFESSKKRIYA